MVNRWIIAGALGLVAFGPPTSAMGQVAFFTDPALFDEALLGGNKIAKASWSFKPHDLADGVLVDLQDVLDISNHQLSPNDPWTDAVGSDLWPPDIDNITFSANLTPPGPYQAHGPDEPGALAFATTGFNGIGNNVLGANYFVDSFDILSGLPAADNHTAMSFELIQLPLGFPAPVFQVTVFNKNDVELGNFTIDGTINQKAFLGILALGVETIGRVDIWDQSGGVEGISSIAVYVSAQPPACPWDCAIPHNKVMDVVDLLALLAEWDPQAPFNCTGGMCDFDASGCVDVVDLLKLLGVWNQTCPTPSNDQCSDPAVIDRLDSNGQIIEPFDMYGATAGQEPYKCIAAQPLHKDIWYCLTNSSNEDKFVSLSSTVDLLIEVNAGCNCPPGPLVVCGQGSAGTGQFPIVAGESVMIRLINNMDLPNDLIKGDLIIDNTTVFIGVNFFTDPANFFDAVDAAGKIEKLFWDFSPHFLPDNTVVSLDDPLDIFSHLLHPDDPWSDGAGGDLWPQDVDNLQFSSNVNPQGPFQPSFMDGLAFLTTGFNGLNNNVLLADFPLNSLDIISGLPVGDNHTAMWMELVRPLSTGVSSFHITVYDKQDQVMGELDVLGPALEKVFVGFVTKGQETIGRVDIHDVDGGFEGISSVAAFLLP